MTDETRKTTTSEILSSAAPPPRQIIEHLIEILRTNDSLSADANQQFNQLTGWLDGCLASRQDHQAHEDAIERAPWLTSDSEQLRRQWQKLQQTLLKICERARRRESSHKSLIDQFNEFAEQFFECDADEHCFLDAAFPGPSWTDESPGSHVF